VDHLSLCILCPLYSDIRNDYRVPKTMVRSAIGILILASAARLAGLAFSPACVVVHAQLTTEDRLNQPGFWPRKSVSSAAEFAGADACASCHSAIATSQRVTPMAATAMLAKDSSELRSHSPLLFSLGSFRYEIRTEGGESIYFVSDGADTLKSTLLWAFGSGPVGQTYLFTKPNGHVYEARVSYFGSLGELHLTPGFVPTSPMGFEWGTARYLDPEETVRCFSCHATASTIGGRFDPKETKLGVNCEACHGPGQQHVDTMRMAKIGGIDDVRDKGIFNPASLSPADSSDFCGACHGSLGDMLSAPNGIQTFRMQPYWLRQSKCWGKDGDPRLTCMACHDPHKPLATDPGFYDKACLNCHPASKEAKNLANLPGRACPVGAKNCVTCHMPNLYSPAMHHTFRDHRIRIVRQPVSSH
jgi:cytochrome c554/c'-like protein